MDIQEINQRIDTLTEELEKLKTLRTQKKIENFNVDLVFHYDPETPDTIYLHTRDKRVPVSSIRELVKCCRNFPSEDEYTDGLMEFIRGVMEGKNEQD